MWRDDKAPVQAKTIKRLQIASTSTEVVRKDYLLLPVMNGVRGYTGVIYLQDVLSVPEAHTLDIIENLMPS